MGLARGARSLVLACAAVLLFLWREKRIRPRRVPFPTTRWPLQLMLEYVWSVHRRRALDCLADWSKRTRSSTFALRFLGMGYVVFTADPRNVEHILKSNFENYPKGPVFSNRLQDLLGRGIFNVDGATWYHQRKLSSRMFTQSAFRDHMFRTFQKHAEHVARLLRGTAGKSEAIDVFDLLNRFTLDSIGEVGFGRDIGSLSDPGNPVARSFDAAQVMSAKRFTTRALYWRLFRLLRISEEGRLRAHIASLDEYARGVSRDAWRDWRPSAASPATRSPAKGAKSDFLSLFIGEMRASEDSVPGREMSAEDEKYCRDVVMNFLLAGRDTTAQALTWTFFRLSQRRDVVDQLRAELEGVFGGGEPSFEGLQNLPYTQAVINEALRLYPSVPKNLKLVSQTDTLPDGTVLPAGCWVGHVPYLMGRSEAIWGEDADEFRPERWIGRDFPSLYTYPVFHAGPRECLGRRMAWLEMKVCLAVLVRRFDFELAQEASEVRFEDSLTLPVYGRLLMRFRERAAPKDPLCAAAGA